MVSWMVMRSICAAATRRRDEVKILFFQFGLATGQNRVWPLSNQLLLWRLVELLVKPMPDGEALLDRHQWREVGFWRNPKTVWIGFSVSRRWVCVGHFIALRRILNIT
jgi:hypothetical protein